ncbi:MAG: hypothetical protein P1Q69_11545, partial [Candidatus Thorarchaeota archaeon]|nr:hypothetical protein [Candidatus Thorarchaeota archaeon]
IRTSKTIYDWMFMPFTMSVELSQLVALATYANVYLRGGSDTFNIEKGISNHCYRFEFLEKPIEGIAGSSKVIASHVSDWFIYLKTIETKSVRLHYESTSWEVPDHLLAAFKGGGGYWLIEVEFSSGRHVYSNSPQFTKGISTQPAKRPVVHIDRNCESWESVYPTVNTARIQLDATLEKLIDFADRYERTKHWAENFRRYRSLLTDFEPDVNDDFIPYGTYSLEAHQLIQAAFASWVFGGMGSWNDQAFDGDDGVLYDTLTNDLYYAVCSAVGAGVNSYPE